MAKTLTKKAIYRMILIKFPLAILVNMALFFGVAGTFCWIEGWLFIIIYMGYGIIQVIWLMKNDPELLKKRSVFLAKDAKIWDKIITFSTIPLFFALMVIPGLEAVRYEWTNIPIYLEIIGFFVMVASFALVFIVMKENSYLSRTVEVQKGHKVISTGPYKYVRHPMYSGVIAMFLAMPLLLGSYYALIPGATLCIVIIIRTFFEEDMLKKELKGYKEYMKKVKYRLIPGIW